MRSLRITLCFVVRTVFVYLLKESRAYRAFCLLRFCGWRDVLQIHWKVTMGYAAYAAVTLIANHRAHPFVTAGEGYSTCRDGSHGQEVKSVL